MATAGGGGGTPLAPSSDGGSDADEPPPAVALAAAAARTHRITSRDCSLTTPSAGDSTAHIPMRRSIAATARPVRAACGAKATRGAAAAAAAAAAALAEAADDEREREREPKATSSSEPLLRPVVAVVGFPGGGGLGGGGGGDLRRGGRRGGLPRLAPATDERARARDAGVVVRVRREEDVRRVVGRHQQRDLREGPGPVGRAGQRGADGEDVDLRDGRRQPAQVELRRRRRQGHGGEHPRGDGVVDDGERARVEDGAAGGVAAVARGRRVAAFPELARGGVRGGGRLLRKAEAREHPLEQPQRGADAALERVAVGPDGAGGPVGVDAPRGSEGQRGRRRGSRPPFALALAAAAAVAAPVAAAAAAPLPPVGGPLGGVQRRYQVPPQRQRRRRPAAGRLGRRGRRGVGPAGRVARRGTTRPSRGCSTGAPR